jgi:hypothetical protein
MSGTRLGIELEPGRAGAGRQCGERDEPGATAWLFANCLKSCCDVCPFAGCAWKIPVGALDPWVDFFVSILTPHENASDVAPTARSIGASLQVLSLDACLGDTHELLDVLVVGEHRLCSLSLGYLQEDSWLLLTRRLPDVVHLRELHLTHVVKRHSSSMDFVRAMRQNGSLHEVSETSIQRYLVLHTPLFGAEELQKIRIYCQRNRMARELLQNASLLCDDTSSGHATTPVSLFRRSLPS